MAGRWGQLTEAETAGGKFPEKLAYFKNQDEAFLYAPYSHIKITAKCPSCGAEKQITVDKLVHRRYFCPKCNDKISKPNKMNREILFQLKERKIIKDFDLEYMIPNSDLLNRFDAHIYYNNKEYFIEIHGVQHKDKRSFRHSGEIIEARDKVKSDYVNIMPNAELIVIWCDKDDFNYRKKNFIEGFNKIGIDITNLDWLKVESTFSDNLIKQVCDYYNKNPNIPLYKIAEHFKLHSFTITEYLRKGNRLGFCNYNMNEHKSKISFNTSHAPKTLVYKEQELLYIFSTQAEAAREMSRIYNKIFNSKSISGAILNKIKYKGFIFRNIDNPLNIDEYNKFYNKNIKNKIGVLVYKENILFGEYKSYSEAVKDINQKYNLNLNPRTVSGYVRSNKIYKGFLFKDKIKE